MKKTIAYLFLISLTACNNSSPIVENYRAERKKMISDYIEKGDIKKSDKQKADQMIDRGIDSLVDLWGASAFADTIGVWKKRDSLYNAELSRMKEKHKKTMDSLNLATYPRQWKYEEKTDEMDNSKTKFAKVYSLNSVDLAYPYDTTCLGLIIRSKNKNNEVMLSIQDGQFAGNYVSETIKIKFDDEQAISVTFSEPTSNNSHVIFLGSERKIIERLKTARRVKIEPYFYNNGKQIFEFNVEGLKWE